MDGFNQALLVSFFSAAIFTFGLPFVLQRMKYELALAGQVYFDGKNKTMVLGKAALIFVGGGLVLAWLMLQLVHHFDSQLEFSSGESYRRADTYAWIARHWVFAFAVGGIIAFKLVAESVNYYLDKEEAKDNLKAAYGAKNWATYDEVKAVVPVVRGGYDNKPIGIHIGMAHFWNGMGHMLTVGGSGQGKGVNLILPAILSDTFVRAGSSLIALDPKGELAAIAAAHFRRWGYDVHIINPFSIAAILGLGNSRFNPFDQIDPNSDDANDLYKVLAMALHNRQTKGEGAFFDNRCRQYIALYISYAHHVGLGNFATVYDWLILSGTERKELLISMLEDETFENKRQAKGILDRLNGEASKTEESIFSTIEEAIDILNDKRLRASLSDSDFDLRTVAQKPTAIFVCIPFEDLKRYSAWVRLFFSFLLRTLTRHYNVDRKVLVLLDEFAQLAYMDEVPASSAVLRGYNVTLWPIVQGLGQLKNLYGDNWEIFVNSAVIKHWLSAGTDNTTADYIAKRMPQALNFIGNNADGTPKEREKQLLNPNEVMSFKSIICEIAGLDKPANFDKVPYWEWPFSDKNASPNPYYKQ